jgi:hypothetical protein
MSYTINNNNFFENLDQIDISDNDFITNLYNYEQQFFITDDDLISCLIQYENDTAQNEDKCIAEIIENIILDCDILNSTLEDEIPVNYALITSETEFKHSDEYIFDLHNASQFLNTTFENETHVNSIITDETEFMHSNEYINQLHNSYFENEINQTEIVETTSSAELSNFINFFGNIIAEIY